MRIEDWDNYVSLDIYLDPRQIEVNINPLYPTFCLYVISRGQSKIEMHVNKLDYFLFLKAITKTKLLLWIFLEYRILHNTNFCKLISVMEWYSVETLQFDSVLMSTDPGVNLPFHNHTKVYQSNIQSYIDNIFNLMPVWLPVLIWNLTPLNYGIFSKL